MSRSYKKTLCVKQGGNSSRYYANYANRRIRHRKIDIDGGHDELMYGAYKKYSNPYDICDWRWFETEHTLRERAERIFHSKPLGMYYESFWREIQYGMLSSTEVNQDLFDWMIDDFMKGCKTADEYIAYMKRKFKK